MNRLKQVHERYADSHCYEYIRENEKISLNCFNLFIWGPGRVFFARKKVKKSLETVP